MSTGIKLSIDEDSVKMVGEYIIEILKQNVDQATLQKALDTLSGTLQIYGTNVSSNVIKMGGGDTDE